MLAEDTNGKPTKILGLHLRKDHYDTLENACVTALKHLYSKDAYTFPDAENYIYCNKYDEHLATGVSLHDIQVANYIYSGENIFGKALRVFIRRQNE